MHIMYELMVLGQLMMKPMHGYLIAKIIGHVIGPFKRVQWGALYPLLRRLEREGYIVPDEPVDAVDGNPRRVFHITEEGCRRFYALMMDTQRHLTDYDLVFHAKVSRFHFLSRRERITLSRHYAVYAQQVTDFTLAKRQELLRDSARAVGDNLDYILEAIDQKVRYWQLELEWSENLIRRELEMPEHSGEDGGRIVASETSPESEVS